MPIINPSRPQVQMTKIDPNTNRTPYKGLTAQLEKKLYLKSRDILDLVKKYPKSKGIAGNLHHSWIEAITSQNPDKEAKKTLIKDIYSAFGSAINILKEGSRTVNLLGEQELADIHCQNRAAEVLTSSFKKAGILTENQFLNLKGLRGGALGGGYSFEINGQKYVIKAFANPDEIRLEDITSEKNKFARFFLKLYERALISTKKTLIENGHGRAFEANRGIYMRKQASHSQYDHILFTDLTNGGMVSHFVDHYTPAPRRIIKDKSYGIFASDVISADVAGIECNMIGKHVYDLGGILVTNGRLANNKIARKTYNKIVSSPANKRLDIWLELVNKKQANMKDVKIGLCESLGLLSKEELKCIPENLLKTVKKSRKISIFDYFHELKIKYQQKMREYILGKIKRAKESHLNKEALSLA